MSSALVGVAALAGYAFVAGLARGAESGSASAAPRVVFGAGIAMVTMVLATSLFAHAAVMLETLNADPQVAKTLWLIEHGSWALIAPPQIAFILGVSAVSLRESRFPRWFGLTGLPVAGSRFTNTMDGESLELVSCNP